MISTQHRWVWCVLLAGLVPLQTASAQSSTAVIQPVALKAPLKIVLSSHTRLAAARRDATAAQYLARAQAQPLYNPEIGAEAISGDTDEYNLSLGQTISTGGKQAARRQLGVAGATLVYAEFEQLRHEIVIQILRAEIDYKTATATARLTKRRSDLMRRFLDTAQKRFNVGDLGQSDVNLARVALATTLDQMAAANSHLAKTESTLLVASQQRDTKRWPDLKTTPAHLTPPADLESIPAVRLARLRASLANANARLAGTLRKPDPRFEVRAGREADDLLLGISVSIPLFARNNFSNEHLAALDAESAATIRANAVELETGIRLSTFKAAYEATLESWQAWQDLIIGQLGASLALNERLWESGEISASDYLLQLDRFLESSQSGINLRFRTQQAWVDWLDVSATWQQWFTKGELL